MGEPQSGEENTAVSSPAEDTENGQDEPQALGDNGQSMLDHLHATAKDQSDIPRIPRDEGNTEKLTPRPKRLSDRASENHHTNGINGGAGGVGVSVTLLTLDAELEPRSSSHQNFFPSPRTSDRDPEMSDLKLIKDFQVRRKYGRRPPPVHSGRQAYNNRNGNRSVVELGLSGTRYFTNGDSSSAPGYNSSLDRDGDSRAGKTPLAAEESGCLPNSTPASSTVASRLRMEEDRVSLNSTAKDLQSPVPSLPPLSPGGLPRPAAVRSENSFYLSSRHMGQSPSLLSNHFGFSTIRPDTFSGMQRRRRLRLNGASDDDLLKELKQNAHKQILACQNMGFTHRGSRAAESVLSLKHTVSPSVFHPSSVFTRHVHKEDGTPAPGAGSRSGTPQGEAGAAEERGRRRVTPAGKLSMPRLVPDRQEKATRRTTLPTVSGSSLQVVLAGHSHGK